MTEIERERERERDRKDTKRLRDTQKNIGNHRDTERHKAIDRKNLFFCQLETKRRL